ncbi:MAG: hypothetical protein ACYDEV_13855 [Acidiferrobacter sp.]
MVFDERTQGRVRMMPLDVGEPEEMRERLRSYLATLPISQDISEAWVEAACTGVSHAGQAFTRLQGYMVNALEDGAPGVPDDTGCAALWRLAAWLGADTQTLATLPLGPALMRQSMASERSPL